jgi:alkylation response protein AidB-like acyl-CoA dehydrogenase
VDFGLTYEQEAIREGVAELCRQFPGEYWRELDREQAYPEAFVKALTEGGWLGALVPPEYGGGGLTIADASIILEEINHQGCNAGACHAQMYTMGTVLRHGSPEQKQRYLPGIASGDLRLQAFGVTEPDAGSNTLGIRTRAERQDDGTWRVNGQKIWTSRFQHSDLMLLLARTGDPGPDQKRWWGLSTFLVDLREAGETIEARPIRTLMNHSTVELFINDLVLPADALVGEEGMGFRYILDGMNAERILIAAECIGDGHWFIDRATAYASERVVFDRPIGQNQGVQFPIARAYASVEAADLMRWKAASLYDAGKPIGPEANMAKLLGSEAAWEAANVCLNVHGGFGFAEEYDVERKFRETRLYITAPVANNLILAYLGQNVLGMPRSY